MGLLGMQVGDRDLQDYRSAELMKLYTLGHTASTEEEILVHIKYPPTTI